MSITYMEGYKYQLRDDYTISLTDLQPEQKALWEAPKLLTDYLSMKKGVMTIYHGYAWDGPSGPAIDTHDFMRGSLVHDALYQLMREKELVEDTYRPLADEVLRRICLQDGMSTARAWWVYKGVRIFGNDAASIPKPTYTSPKE